MTHSKSKACEGVSQGSVSAKWALLALPEPQSSGGDSRATDGISPACEGIGRWGWLKGLSEGSEA